MDENSIYKKRLEKAGQIEMRYRNDLLEYLFQIAYPNIEEVQYEAKQIDKKKPEASPNKSKMGVSRAQTIKSTKGGTKRSGISGCSDDDEASNLNKDLDDQNYEEEELDMGQIDGFTGMKIPIINPLEAEPLLRRHQSVYDAIEFIFEI